MNGMTQKNAEKNKKRRKKNNAVKKYKRYRDIYFRPRVFYIFLFLTFICIGTDVTRLYKKAFEKLISEDMNPQKEAFLSALCLLLPENLEANSSVFFAVWGVAIALAVFMIEISGSYHCGISMKRITKWQWGNHIYWGAGEYLALGPLAYLCTNAGWKVTSLWCVVSAFAGMAYMLIYFQCFMHMDVIQELLADKTRNEICALRKKGLIMTHSDIDNLPVADMLDHIDYEQADEIKMLLNTLKRVMQQSQENIRGTSLENTLLVTWVKHIVRKSGISTEAEKERTLNLLSQLWKMLTGTRKSTQKECLSYSLQLMIPFLDLGGRDAEEMFVRVWKVLNLLNLYGRSSLIYLLLYTEFRFWFVDGRVHEWIRTEDSTVQYELDKIRRGEFCWDEETAWQYWLDWRQYGSLRGDIGLRQFGNFCQCAEALQSGEMRRMRPSVLLYF